ncbi:MAG: HEAT repeat domain-containing protein [Candidatus Aminicenantes bacterium]|jgi:HEAT repeat protein
MTKKEKLVLLQNFKEKHLIENVILPLLEKIGSKNIMVTHGTLEKGKDLIFYKKNEFGEREYTGVQIKAADIHGRASQEGNATEILNQAQQAFTHEFIDIYDNKKKNIDRYIVITSGGISENAKESISGQLRAVGCYKSIHFFDGNKLVELVEQYIPDFFGKEYNYFNRYFKMMKKDFETIRDISSIGQRETIGLEDIYVSLKLSEKSIKQDFPVETGGEIFDDNWMSKKPEGVVEKAQIISPDAAVRKFNRIVILGAPGAGKTTMLKYLAIRFCKENIEKHERIFVPIPIILREFIRSGKSLREYIETVFEKYEFPEAMKIVEKDLGLGKCILLLDGFDELSDRENQEKVAKEIHEFTENYHNCKMLITSRIAGYHDELKGFTRLELMELDKDQIKMFIDKWFGASHHKKVESMLQAVMKNKNIGVLAKNPLMISIIAIICEEERELPQRRADLYNRVVDVLLSKWDVRRRISNRFLPDKKEFILKKLAFRCQCRNQRIIPEKDILNVIEEYSLQIGIKKEEARTFLEEIWKRSYILRQNSIKTYDFLHLSFMEYFVALELKDRADGIETIISQLFEPCWEEPILLYAGISRDAAPLIKRIMAAVPDDMFFSILMLLGKCIADAEFTEPELKEKIIQHIWDIYENTELQLLRKRSLDVFSRMKPANIINRLSNRLSNKDSSIRKNTVDALGAIGSVDAIPSLIKIFTTDKDSSVREHAAEALVIIGSPEPIPQLLYTLNNHEKVSVRGLAAYVLGAIGNTEIIPQLTRAFFTEKDSLVRGRAANALGVIGKAEVIPQLIEVFNSDRDSIIRGYVAKALAAIGSPTSIPHLIKALTDSEESSVQWNAAEALGAIGSTDPIPHLMQALTSNKNSVRWSAAYALGIIGSTESIPQLVHALNTDQDSSVRGRAADALGAIGNVEAVPHLIKTLTNDTDSSIRGRAAEALGAIGNVEPIPQLIHALSNDEESFVRWHAAEALGAIGSIDAITSLIRALTNDADSSVRGRSAEALGIIGSKETLQPLKNALNDNGFYYGDNVKVKDAAFESLEKISRRLGKKITK